MSKRLGGNPNDYIKESIGNNFLPIEKDKKKKLNSLIKKILRIE
jgi:hypothetical protein